MADSKITGFLSKDTAGLPNWAWLLVVGAGIAAVYVIPKFTGNKASSTGSTGSTDTSGLGLAVDPTTGLPYAVEGLVPSGGTAPPAPPVGPPSFLGPPQTFTNFQATLRQKATDPNAATYNTDLTSGGIPILGTDQPTGQLLGRVPYGGQITITGPAVQGGYNLAPGETGGSTLWYPVQFQGRNGYISAYDLVNMPSANVRTTAVAWPGQV